jgi:hypothetical protein
VAFDHCQISCRSGSSISRPHLHGSAHPVPTTAQQLLAELAPVVCAIT